MSNASLELIHEKVIERVDRLHRAVQRPITTYEQVVELADMAKEIHSLLARAVSVKTLDEAADVA